MTHRRKLELTECVAWSLFIVAAAAGAYLLAQFTDEHTADLTPDSAIWWLWNIGGLAIGLLLMTLFGILLQLLLDWYKQARDSTISD